MSSENIGVIFRNDQNCMTMSFQQLENAEFEFHILNKNWYIYQYVEKTK